MTSESALRIIFKRLQTAKMNKVPIFVEVKRKCIKSLLEALEANSLLIINQKCKTYYEVKSTETISKIETPPTFMNVKKNHIETCARKMLPNSMGHLILSTTMGIMSHNDAIRQKLGGQIIGLIY